MCPSAFLFSKPLQTQYLASHIVSARCGRRTQILNHASGSENDESEERTPEKSFSKPSSNPSTSRRSPSRRRMSAFEATIDNLTMKRMGRGTQYYGQRVEADIDEGLSPAIDEESDNEITVPIELRPNAVVVIGGTGRTGQWVSLGLANNGFIVRVITRSVPRAESMFGPAGSNVDIVNADITQPDTLSSAIVSASALVICSAAPRWLPFSHDAVDVRGVEHVIQAAVSAQSVERIILVSDAGVSSAHAKAKRRAEEIVKESGIPYVIIRVAALRDGEGGRQQIDMRPIVSDSKLLKIKPVTRVDLAQCICQALVHHRRVASILQEDPLCGVAFPNCVVSVANSDAPYIPNRRFWTSLFNRVSETFTIPSELDEDRVNMDSDNVT